MKERKECPANECTASVMGTVKPAGITTMRQERKMLTTCERLRAKKKKRKGLKKKKKEGKKK